MPKNRFRDRRFELADLIDRFEAVSAETHARSARGAIERLRDEGREKWKEGSEELCQWRRYCNEIRKFVSTEMGNRRFEQEQGVETAFREFVAEFEHSRHRMLQMLYGTSEDPGNDEYIHESLDLIEAIYRLCTYTIVSHWIDEKHEENTVKIEIDIDVRDQKNPQIDSQTTMKHRPMPKPSNPQHSRGMKRLR